jgi:uncharacterized damage-inducible protein DinB
MNASAIRQLFEYHFFENHKLIADYASQLSPAQYIQPIAYSHGSVRDQLIHMMRVDEAWFSDLRGEALPETQDGQDYPDLDSLWVEWVRIEQKMREYLKGVSDEELMDKPLEGEDQDLRLWQVLVHVVNHGTDHRAQILRALNDLGIKTHSQDFIFYVYENPS